MSGPRGGAIVSEASAPGKLILFGEHAVVYGHTAIAGALSDLRASTAVVRRAWGARFAASACISCACALKRVLPSRDPLAVQTSAPTGILHVALPSAILSAGAAAAVPHEPHAGDAAGAAAHPPAGDFAVALPALVASLRSAFTPLLHASSTSSSVIHPTPHIVAALTKVVAVHPDVAARTALLPTVFLVAGIFREWLFGEPASPLRGLSVTVKPPTLPVGAGLGSSAAFSVSTAAALLDALEVLTRGSDADANVEEWEAATPPAASLTLINEWAFAAEMLFHGTPSGLDNTVAT